jgi:hypothetical protein
VVRALKGVVDVAVFAVAAQFVQACAPAAPAAGATTYLPASQLVQTEAPVKAIYVPAPQATQFDTVDAT